MELPIILLSMVLSAGSAAAEVTAASGVTHPTISLSSGTNAAGSTQSASVDTAPQDLAASRFLSSCAGCHSLGGAKLSGPDLLPVSTWPQDALKLAIKKMESKVGPLTEGDVAMLTDFLQDAQTRERLKAAEARLAQMFMAKMKPADPLLGQALFFGREPLRNGGLACMACHAVQGQGGNLGLDLTGSFAKLGEIPLISAIEKANFIIMGPHYSRHPVTRQEAMHLTKYLSTLDPKTTPRPAFSFAALGTGSGLAAFAGLLFYYGRAKTNHHPRPQRRRK